MTDIEKDSNINSIKEDTKENEVLEQKIEEICKYFRNEGSTTIKEVDEWKISDFFDINDLERIKQTPEYIIEKIIFHFKNFISLKDYFFIMKPNQNLQSTFYNKKINKDSEKEKEKVNKKEKEIKNKKEIVYKNDINRKKKIKEEKNYEAKKNDIIEKKLTKKKEEIKNKKTDKIIKEFSNSIDIKKSNQLLHNYNLDINIEKKKFSNSFDKKKINTLNKEKKKYFLKKIFNKKNEFVIIDNPEENKKCLNSFENEKKDLLLYKEKELNNNLINSSSTSKNEINKKINSSDFPSNNNIKDSSSTCKNEFEINQQINSSYFSSNNNNTSTFNNMPLSDSYSSLKIKDKNIEKKDEKKNKEIDNYKFNFFKKQLNLEEEDSLSGNAYEEYARKTIKLMLILSIKKMPIFYNPQKIEIDYLIQFYLKQYILNKVKLIDTPIKELLFDKTKKNKNMEIDIVFELKKNEITNFIDKFQSKIYFKDYFKNEDNKEEITCFIEIARNLISQGKEKLEQIKKYIKIIKIMNIMRNLVVTDIEEYKKILSKYKCSKGTEKVFAIITDGNYNELNFVLNDIVKPLLKDFEGKDLNNEYIENIKNIKDFIRNKINKKELFGNIINKDSLFDNICNVFELFYHLKINNICFCLIYIGEIYENTCNLTSILNYLKEQECLNDKGMKLNDYIDKRSKSILNLEEKYNEIKSTINEFEKECRKNIVFNKESIDNIFDEINFDIFDFDYFISRHKFQCNAFIFFKEENNSENIVISKLQKYFQFNKENSELNIKLVEKKIFDFQKIDKDTPYFLIFKNEVPNFIWFLAMRAKKPIFIFLLGNKGDKGEENVIYFTSDDLINKINIETSLKRIINQEISSYQSSYFEEQRLMPTNLGKKLTNDLNIIFKINGNLNIEGIIHKIKFEIPETNENKLLNYFDKISKILTIEKMNNYPEIKINFIKNFGELKVNILSRHFYNVFLHKIGNHFAKKLKEGLNKEISNYKLAIA